MPFERPSLSELRLEVKTDINSNLPGSDPLLRNSNLGILADAMAALAHGHYGYLDFIALNGVPFTATGEYLEAWASLKGVNRIPATKATGSVEFTGTAGAIIPAGTLIVRGDGVEYTTDADITLDIAGEGTGTATASEAGAAGDCVSGSVLVLGVSIAGVNSNGEATTPFAGGADQEDDESLRSRMLLAYANPAQGGNANDYVQWAREVPGVTRAWTLANGMGVGTVVVYFMMDEVRSAFDGFPQGTDGGATDETRTTPAVGDQLLVANHIYPLRPVTALVYAVSPIQNDIDLTIDNLGAASVATKAAIAAAVADVFSREGAPGATINLSSIESAIAAVANTAGFVITSPTDNIAQTTGQLPVLGVITYT